LLLLVLHPLLEFPDRCSLGRKFDVGVNRVDFRARRVAHERHPDFLEDARFHEAGIERVAKIVETDVA
jgi:hypothetical protein